MIEISAEVRVALPQDEEAIMELCRLLHAENAIASMNEDKVRNMIRRALNPDKKSFAGLCGVIGPVGGPLSAVCYLFVSQLWYTDDWHLEEVFLFVHPEHRRKPYGRIMMRFMKATSERLGIPLLTGIVSNHRTEAKVRLYERELVKAGAWFLYNIHEKEKEEITEEGKKNLEAVKKKFEVA